MNTRDYDKPVVLRAFVKPLPSTRVRSAYMPIEAVTQAAHDRWSLPGHVLLRIGPTVILDESTFGHIDLFMAPLLEAAEALVRDESWSGDIDEGWGRLHITKDGPSRKVDVRMGDRQGAPHEPTHQRTLFNAIVAALEEYAAFCERNWQNAGNYPESIKLLKEARKPWFEGA